MKQKTSGGWMKMHRTAAKRMLSDPALAQVWLALNAWATYKPRERAFVGRKVWCERGQCPTSSRGLAKACGLTREVAQRALRSLERMGLIRTESRGDCSVVTVLFLAAENNATSDATDHSTPDATCEGAKAAPAKACAAASVTSDATDHSTPDATDDSLHRDVTMGDGLRPETLAHQKPAEPVCEGDDQRLADWDRTIVDWMHGELEAQADCAVPIDRPSWVAEIRELRFETGADHKRMTATLRWAMRHPFWGDRITSAAAFRGSFVTLEVQRRRAAMRAVKGGFR